MATPGIGTMVAYRATSSVTIPADDRDRRQLVSEPEEPPLEELPVCPLCGGSGKVAGFTCRLCGGSGR